MPVLSLRRRASPARRAAQLVVVAFVAASLLGGLALSIPGATAEGAETSFLDALFTATSAVCVTGLTVVDTAGHWSPLGQGIILGLIQVGGFGIMTLSSLVVVLLAKRLGLRHRLVASAETGVLAAGDVRRILLGVARFSLVVETLVAAALLLRFWLGHGEPFGRAAWLGTFHAISAFNNAGFALFSDSLAGYARDPITLLVITGAVIVGGLGYPVWAEVVRAPRRPGRWSLHAKITVVATSGLLVAGAGLFAWFEWTNPDSLGGLSTADSALSALFHSAMPRTAGFAAFDIAEAREPTRLLIEALMFIGGGSASTAGGIKVTTFALLGWVMWAEARGDTDVVAFGRRIPEGAQRQAVTVALLALGVVVASAMTLMAVSNLPRADLFFEAVSALGTVGLSTGATPMLPEAAQLVVIALMVLGRVGPVTLAAALVLRQRQRRYRHPVERPLIG